MVNLTGDTRQRLRDLRRLHPTGYLSQQRLAFSLGMPLTRYWKIEGGYGVPTLAEAERIAAYLERPARDLFPELPWPAEVR